MSPSTERDPFAPIDVPPRGRRVLALLGFASGIAALWLVPIVLGAVGMVLGMLSHVKGDRLGFPAAATAAVTMFVGLSLGELLSAPPG